MTDSFIISDRYWMVLWISNALFPIAVHRSSFFSAFTQSYPFRSSNKEDCHLHIYLVIDPSRGSQSTLLVSLNNLMAVPRLVWWKPQFLFTIGLQLLKASPISIGAPLQSRNPTITFHRVTSDLISSAAYLRLMVIGIHTATGERDGQGTFRQMVS